MVGRDAERDARVSDLALRPREPPLHRRRRNEERARDLLRAQTPQRAQGQRDLRLQRERRVAAGEDELQPLVGEGRFLHLVLCNLWNLEQAGFRGQRAVAADAVDRAVPGRRHEPGAGVGRTAFAGPALGSGREGLLGRLLGEVEIAEVADQGGDHAPPLVAKDLLDRRPSAPRPGEPQ
jgi:hypothetical protein